MRLTVAAVLHVAALALVVQTTLGQEIVSQEGNIVLKVENTHTVLINNDAIATQPDIQRLESLLKGLTGMLMGPDYRFQVQLLNDARTTVFWAVEFTAAINGLAKPGQVPYEDLSAWLPKTLAAESLCSGRVTGPGSLQLTVVATLASDKSKIRSSTTQLQVNNQSGTCADAEDSLKNLVASVTYEASDFGGLLGLLRATNANDLSALSASLTDGLTETNEDVAEVVRDLGETGKVVDSNKAALNQRVNETVELIGQVEESLVSDIEDIQRIIGTQDSTLQQALDQQKAIRDCHSKGLLYDGSKCVVAIDKHCSDRPTSVPAFAITATGTDKCPANTMQFGGDLCAYKCPTHYTSNGGQAQFSCNSDGVWELQGKSSLTCTPKSCPKLADTTDLKFVCASNLFGGAGCTVACQTGFERVSGATTATCLPDSSPAWAYDLNCKRVDCSESIPSLTLGNSNGMSDCSKAHSYQDTCQASCQTGFLGQASFVCNASGQWQLSGPPLTCLRNAYQQALQTPDGLDGCPGKRAANTKLISRSFTLDRESSVWVTSHLIRSVAGRADLFLFISNVGHVDSTLTYSFANEWAEGRVFWTGVLPPGTYEAFVQSDTADVWGCRADWGDLDIFWIDSQIATAYQVNDDVRGCPNTARPGAKLLVKQFDVPARSLILTTAHMIRSGFGRADMQLFLDDNLWDETLIYVPKTTSQWADLNVYGAAEVSKGSHTVYISGSENGRFGCEQTWGDLNILVIHDPTVYSVAVARDAAVGCPATRAAEATLITLDISVPSDRTAVFITAKIISLSAERADLWLKIDDVIRDRSLVPSTAGDGKQWRDLHTFWVGQLSKGAHRITLSGTLADTFGCQTTWGKIEAILVGS